MADPTFLERAFRVTDPITMVTVGLIGIVLGALFFAAFVAPGRRWVASFAMLVVGVVFFTFCAMSRALQGVVEWPGWIGVGVLWLVFTAGAHAGLVLRRVGG